MITLLKILPDKWEQAKGYLRLDLEALEAAMNQRWSVTFGANNLLNPDTIQGWVTTQTRYVSNEATDPATGWPMWAQVNLSNGVKNRLPFSNFVAATAGSTLVGRRSGSSGDFEQIALGTGLTMAGTTLHVDISGLAGRIPIPDEPYREDPWPMGSNVGGPIATTFTPGSVIFAGPSGFLAQDNSGLFFDSANNRLGIGVASPSYDLDVRSTTPILGASYSANTGFAALRYYEVTTLVGAVQFLGSNFTTSARRNNIEIFNLTSAGGITFHTNNQDTPKMFLNTTGYLGIGTGTSTPGGTLDISGSFTADQAFAFRATATHSTATAGTVYGAQFNTRMSHTTGTQNAIQTFFIQSYYQGTSATVPAVTSMVSVFARSAMAGTSPTGTVTNARVHEIDSIANQASGAPAVTFTNAVGVFIRNQGAGTGSGGLTITNAAGLIVGDQTGPAGNLVNALIGTLSIPSGTWSIHNASTAKNYFAGLLQMGHTTTWATGTNFISFADGTAPGTPATDTAAIYANDVSGTVKLFGITEGGVTGELTMNSAALTSGRIALVTTNGLLTDDAGITYDATDNRINVDQVRFPATQAASSDANTLDDYEEGDWTPTLTFGGGSTGITYSVQLGKYTKIGRFVACSGTIVLSNKGSSTGNAVITNLPFTIGTGNGFLTSAKVSYSVFTAGVQEVGIQGIAASATAYAVKSVTGTNTIMTEADFTNTSSLIVYICFMID